MTNLSETGAPQINKNMVNSTDKPPAYQDFERNVLSILFSKIRSSQLRVAVLRNYETLPESISSRDIDFVVHDEDWTAADSLVHSLAKECGCRIAKYYKDDMFSSMSLMRRLDDGRIFTISIDFFRGRRVYGVELLAAQDMVETVRDHKGVPIVRAPFVFLDKWVYHLFVGQSTKARYDSLFAKIVADHSGEIEDRLVPILGRDETQRRLAIVREGRSSQMDVLSTRNRLALICRLSRRRGLAGLACIMKFLGYRMRDFFKPSGIFLSISGPDGSGKTTVIEFVLGELSAVYGKDAVKYKHFRPAALPRIAEIAQKVRVVESVDKNYHQPHRAKPSRMAGSAIRFGYYWLDYMVGYFTRIRPLLNRPHVMVFDRYYFDMIADPFRSRIALPNALLRSMGRLLPLPRYAFFIHVDANEVHRRKQELTLEQIIELNGRYNHLTDRGWMIAIDNNGTPERAAAAIVDHIVADRDHKAHRGLALKKVSK